MSRAAPSNAFGMVQGLGPKSRAMLAAAGMHSLAELRRVGAVAAYLAVRRVERTASLNLPWALEGALSGRDWRTVARDDRLRLLLEVERLQAPT